jgi:hypothetical protein
MVDSSVEERNNMEIKIMDIMTVEEKLLAKVYNTLGHIKKIDDPWDADRKVYGLFLEIERYFVNAGFL